VAEKVTINQNPYLSTLIYSTSWRRNRLSGDGT